MGQVTATKYAYSRCASDSIHSFRVAFQSGTSTGISEASGVVSKYGVGSINSIAFRKMLGVVLLVICLIVQGCVSSTFDTGNKLDGQRVAQIQKGVTPISTLIAEFGPPQTKTTQPDGSELYQFMSMSSTTGGGGPLAFIGLPTETKSSRSIKTLMVGVRNGIVISCQYNEGN